MATSIVNWVGQGHVSGPNTNNVSATISVKEGEWDEVGQWMWDNKHIYNGLSVLPHDGGSYKDAPFQEVDEETYNRKLEYIKNNKIDLTGIVEEEDYTDQKGEIACGPGGCEVL